MKLSELASKATSRLAYLITGDRRALPPDPDQTKEAQEAFAQAFAGREQTQPATQQEQDAQAAEPAAPPRPARFDGPWLLDSTLMRFRRGVRRGGKVVEEKVPYTLSDAYMGIFCLGGNGAGKTSGTGVHVGAAYLKAGMGGLVLCAKATEANDWEKRVKAAGRGDDLIMFGRKEEDAFNFLQYEIDHAETTPARAAVDVLMELVGAQGGDSKNKFWEDSARRLITACVDALILAGERVTVSRLHDLSVSVEAAKEVIQKAFNRRDAGELTKTQMRDADQRAKYLLNEWPTMAKDTRSGILAHMTTALDPFLTGEMRDRFTENTTVTPDDIMAGKILVCTLSHKTHSEAGRSANILWKYCTQRAVERRQPDEWTRPCFIFADEAQFFVTKRDADFVTTSRSSRTSMIYLTQSKANLLSRMSKDETDAILACFQTPIFHHNTDRETNEYAAETIAKTSQVKKSHSDSFQANQNQGGGNNSTSMSVSVEHQLMPVEFTRLGTGGEKNNCIVTAILYLHGDVFSTGGLDNEKVSYVLVFFNQRQIII